MKKLKGSPFAKACVIILSVLLALVFVACLVATVVLAGFGAFPSGYEQVLENALSGMGIHRCYNYGEYVLSGGVYFDGYVSSDYPDGSNFRLSIYDEEENLVYQDYNGEAVLWEGGVYFYPNFPVDLPEDESNQEVYYVKGYILEDMSADDDIRAVVSILKWTYFARYQLIVYGLLALIVWVLLFVFLMCAAGHRDENGPVQSNALDRIPFDVFVLVIGTVLLLLISLVFGGSITHAGTLIVVAALAIIVGEPILILFCMSLATRLKLGGVLRSCLVYRVTMWCWRTIKKLCQGLMGLVRALPLLGRWGAALGGLLLVEFIFILATEYSNGMELFGWLVESAVFTALLLYFVVCARKIRRGAQEIAGGNEGYKIDTKDMRGELLRHAEDLNNISDGISRAVDERMKSEHFRTELITNVSHDIKTPLTSIINYVDLLGKEQPENEKSREYIEVLSRQSAKLKKLIEDLMEASKASTGNLSVNLERCELGVLLDQTAGEYAEKLSAAGLELVLSRPEETVTVMADGRHMWRVFDNLMSNACKYAQPGTRVYLSLERQGDRARIIFRNISRSQLNISGDELMERFVRGDSSRNTEGSGLGLSIARSLMQLQKGSMDLTVDGDLFKVVLSLGTAD